MTDLSAALDAIRRWGEARDWSGYDPYDALSSPLTPALTLGRPLGRRAMTQAVKRSPVNLRPLLRIPQAHNAKALGLVASGYARLGAARGDETATLEAERWLDRLHESSTADVGLGWGYHFDVQTRFFSYRAGTPNAIATSFVGHALLDGLELLGLDRYAAAVREVGAFLLARLLDEDDAAPFFRYLPSERALVHNASLLACSVLARAAAVTGERLDARVVPAVRTSLAAQRPDGFWPYAVGPAGDWVDNFHTGYVLESLAACQGAVEDLRPALERGLESWQRDLFEADGTPRHSTTSLYPIDAHDYAQAIETWLSVAAWWPAALERAERCAQLLVDRLLDPRGHVAFQRGRFLTNRVPFVRWTTAPTFRALARLELEIERARAAGPR
jgi:hypothetical protein